MSALNTKFIYTFAIIAVIISLIGAYVAIESIRTSNMIANQLQQINSTLGSLSAQILSMQQLASQNIQLINQSISSQLSYLDQKIAQMSFPIQIYDALNRTVVITHQPTRIVSLAPSITEILFSINASNLVVGVDDFSNYPPQVNTLVKEGKIVRVGGFSTISLEKVISLNPDLVIGTTGVQYKFVYQLSQYGITSISLKTESIDDILTATLLLGKITGHYNEALKVVDKMKSGILAVYNKTSNATQRPSVLYLVWVNPFYVAGGASFWNDVISISGGTNAMSNISQAWPSVSWEQIISANPDVIIASEYSGGFTSATQLENWLSQQPGGSNLSAVIHNKIYMLHGDINDIAARPSPRIVIMMQVLSAILHPEIYGNINIPNDIYLDNVTAVVSYN